MKNKNSILKAVLIMGISSLALTACESSDWWDDDATYAGDVKPPAEQGVETAAGSGEQVVPPPSQEILQTLPPASPQPTPEFTSSLAPPPPPVVPNQYTGNLASVPPRPAAADLPSASQVQAARQDLNADNQKLNSTLKDPSAAALPSTGPSPLAQNTVPPMAPAPVYTLPAVAQASVAPVPMQPYAPPVIPPAPAAPMPMPAANAPQYTPPPAPTYSPAVPMPVQQAAASPAPVATAAPVPLAPPPAATDSNVSGRLLGLQPSGPGKYSLVQLAPDTGIGSFSLTSSILADQPGNQINIVQYQDLRRVAAQYATQKGRVRLVSYSNDPQSQEALQRATTVAAYLIDLGVPSSAIRMRIDPIAGNAPPASPAARKTDVFLEVPITK